VPNKYRLLLFLLIATFVLFFLSGCIAQYPAVPTTGSINIFTNPSGAKIFLDSIDTGFIKAIPV